MKGFFSFLGFKNRFGTQAAIIEDKEVTENFKKEYTLNLPENLQERFKDLRLKRAGFQDALNNIAHQLGAVRISENELWEEVRREYFINKDTMMEYNYDSGTLLVYTDGNKK